MLFPTCVTKSRHSRCIKASHVCYTFQICTLHSTECALRRQHTIIPKLMIVFLRRTPKLKRHQYFGTEGVCITESYLAIHTERASDRSLHPSAARFFGKVRPARRYNASAPVRLRRFVARSTPTRAVEATAKQPLGVNDESCIYQLLRHLSKNFLLSTRASPGSPRRAGRGRNGRRLSLRRRDVVSLSPSPVLLLLLLLMASGLIFFAKEVCRQNSDTLRGCRYAAWSPDQSQATCSINASWSATASGFCLPACLPVCLQTLVCLS